MNTSRNIMLTGMLCILTMASTLLAQVPTNRVQTTPGIINYQGRLTKPAGDPYSNGVYQIEFRLYEADTGSSSGLWACVWSAYVKDGYFNVMLGAPGASASTNLPTYGPTELWRALWYDQANPSKANDRYLGIKVLSGADSTLPSPAVEAFPRQRFISAPFAERAQMAEYARAAYDTFTVGTTLSASGMVTAAGGLTVRNTTTLTNTTVGGSMTLNQGVTVNNVQGLFNKGLTVTGAIAYAKSGLEVTGAAVFKGGVNAAGGKVQEGGNDLIPKGVIVMWSGTTPPAGWALCDGGGSPARPNLKGRFVVGYDPGDGDYNSTAKTGGERTHVLDVTEMPSHTHTARSAANSSGDSSSQGWPASDYHRSFRSSDRERVKWLDAPAIENTGGGLAHENRPPYYVLAYIIKL